MELKQLNLDTETFVSCANIWNSACGESLGITPGFVMHNTLPSTGVSQAGQVALNEAGSAIGFVLASCMLGFGNDQNIAWIDAIAVQPKWQSQGVGRALTQWAQHWLGGKGVTHASVGGGMRPFAPGLFSELNNTSAFERLGFSIDSRQVWDVSADLQTDLHLRPIPQDCTVSPANSTTFVAIERFMKREFPGRWTYELGEHIREGQAPGEFMVLRIDGEIEGFAHVTFEHSLRPIERWYMYGLAHPWGQLGPIGVSAHLRGHGYGGAMLSGGLAHLKAAGVHGCIIDWTNLTEFYGKWGFRRHRRYVMASIGV